MNLLGKHHPHRHPTDTGKPSIDVGKFSRSLPTRLMAEAFGTSWVVFGGCGSAVIAAGYPDLGIGFLGVALAFGLTVLTAAYGLGYISGGHFNPAVSIGVWAAGRFQTRFLLPYIFAQVLGGLMGAGLLYLVASGKPGFDLANGFACNGFGGHSPGGYSMLSGIFAECALTFMFVLVILGCTDERAPGGFAPLAIGLTLALIHMISIPVTNTSVNPARSTGVALIAQGWALQQLWFFWLFPIGGGLVGALTYRLLFRERPEEAREAPPAAAPRPA